MRESHPQAEINFSALARAGEGLTQWRPLLLGFLTLLLAVALAGLGVWSIVRMQNTFGSLLGLLLNLVAIVVVLAGTSGVGAMLMDRAQKVPVRGYLDAGIFGLMCIPKFLGFGLVVALAGLAFFLVAALVYFICKIPVLGAVLAFVAHPLLIMVGSALLVATLFVVNPLFAPAVWSGLSMKDALISVIGIASQRLVPVVLMQLMLYGVVGMTAWLLTAGLLPVGLSLTGLAASIMADGEGMASMMGGFGGGYGGGYGGYGGGYGGGGSMGMLGGLMSNGSLIGMAMGLVVMLVVLSALLAQVMILGLNLVYLQAQENLDTSDTSSRFNRWLAAVLERSKAAAQAAKEKARQVKEAADQKAQEIKAANEERRLERERQAAEKAEHDRVERERQAEENAKQEALDRQAAEQAERERERIETEKAATAERERQQEAERKVQALALAEGERQAAAAKEEEATRRAAEQSAQQEEERLRAAAEAKTVAAAAPSCPSCHSPVGASDAFCGECGHKLK